MQELCHLFCEKILDAKFIEEYGEKLIDDDDVYSDENLNFLNFYYIKLKKIIEKIMPQKGKILDVGCSRGYFLDVLDDWETYGIEMSKTSAQIAEKKHGEKIQTCFFENYPETESFFDVITFQDCLDHFINPIDAIQKSKRMLKEGGVLVIKVHNHGCLWAKISKEEFYAIIPPFHLQYFNTKSLAAHIEKEGFEIKKIKYIPHILQLKTVFYRFAMCDKKSLFYKIYEIFKKIPMIGNIPIYKNLKDIVTIVAVKTAQ